MQWAAHCPVSDPDRPRPFRYSSSGHHIFDTGIPSAASYFSMDGGGTDLEDCGQKSDPGDFLNPPWEVQSGDPSSLLTQNDLFNEYGQLTTGPTSLSDVDLKVMDAIGFQDALSNPLEPQSVLPVAVGGAATISHSFYGRTIPPPADQLTYVLMSGPEHGAILVDGAAAARFTQADIDNGGVQYVENGDNANFDGFTFQLFGPAGNHTQTEPFRIAILDHTGPTVATNNDFTLAAGSHGPINSLFLDTVALGDATDQIIYQVTAVPEHGALLVGGVAFPLFTQAQIDEGLVGYINNGDGATSDSFSFVAWDADAEWAAGRFNIALQPSSATGSSAGQQTVTGASDGGNWQGSVPAGYKIAGTGDFHGNGSSDILLRNPTSGDVGELRSDNGMNFSDIGWAGAGWEVAGTTDLNGDGTTDVVLDFPGSSADVVSLTDSAAQAANTSTSDATTYWLMIHPSSFGDAQG